MVQRCRTSNKSTIVVKMPGCDTSIGVGQQVYFLLKSFRSCCKLLIYFGFYRIIPKLDMWKVCWKVKFACWMDGAIYYI